MNGRVNDVKQWGKHGDKAPLEEMKAVPHSLSSTQRKDKLLKLVRKAVKEIATYHKKNSYSLLLSSKAHWYPVFRLLVDWGFFASNSPQAFCDFLEKQFEDNKSKSLKAHLCDRNDLRQAGTTVFTNHKALDWKHLSQEELGNTQDAKFKRYCDIVDVFMEILREAASKEGVNIDELLED